MTTPPYELRETFKEKEESRLAPGLLGNEMADMAGLRLRQVEIRVPNTINDDSTISSPSGF